MASPRAGPVINSLSVTCELQLLSDPSVWEMFLIAAHHKSLSYQHQSSSSAGRSVLCFLLPGLFTVAQLHGVPELLEIQLDSVQEVDGSGNGSHVLDERPTSLGHLLRSFYRRSALHLFLSVVKESQSGSFLHSSW